MLSLENFEDVIDQVILKRGKQYFKNKAIIWLEETDENVWQAEVEGTESYEVELTLLANMEVNSHSCSCPYDGATCKHVVAVMYAVSEKLKKAKKKKPQKPKTKKDIFERLLQNISAEEYRDFIRSYASRDKNFKLDFELHFAEKDDQIDIGKKYNELVKKLISKYSSRGFVDYRATFGLAKEVRSLLRTGADMIGKGNYRDAFSLTQSLLHSLIQTITHSDDSAGNIGDAIFSTIQLVENIAHAGNAALELKEEMFLFLKNELQHSIYFDYGDYGYLLFEVFKELAILLSKGDEFLAFVDKQIEVSTGEYEEYRREYFQKSKIDFLNAVGRTDEAEKLISKHLDIVSVRREEVNKVIAQQDYARAKELIAEGIRIAESKKHPGTVAEWEKKYLEIAFLEKDIDKIRHYTKYFAFDRGFSQQYYNLWKSTFTETEWKTEIEGYIAEVKGRIINKADKNPIWYSPTLLQLIALAPIYIEEKFWDRLFDLVKKDGRLDTLIDYHHYLLPLYSEELLNMYLKGLKEFGEKASGRSDYARLVDIMQQVINDIPEGKEQILALAREMRLQYNRRPAMIDELSKLFA